MDAGGTPAEGVVGALWGWCVSADAQAYSALDPGWLWVGDMMCDGCSGRW